MHFRLPLTLLLTLAACAAGCGKTKSSSSSASPGDATDPATNTAPDAPEPAPAITPIGAPVATTPAAIVTASPTPVTAAFLTATEISPAAVITTDGQNELLAALNGETEVYNVMPPSASGPCDQVLGDLVLTATASVAAVGAEFDITDCSNSPGETNGLPPSFTVTKATVKIFAQIVCTGYDLSSFNGKSFGDEETASLSSHCPDAKVIDNIVTTVDLTGTGEDSTGAEVPVTSDSRTIDFIGRADLTPCHSTESGGITRVDDGCITISRVVTDSYAVAGANQPQPDDYLKLTKVGITHDASSEWYSSGTIDVVYDTFTGTLTYTGGNTAPTYVFTDSTPGLGTLKGTLSGTPAASSSALMLGDGSVSGVAIQSLRHRLLQAFSPGG